MSFRDILSTDRAIYNNSQKEAECIDKDKNKLKKEKINKVSLIAFTKNDVGNAFWNQIGWTKREDLNYYEFTLNEVPAFVSVFPES